MSLSRNVSTILGAALVAFLTVGCTARDDAADPFDALSADEEALLNEMLVAEDQRAQGEAIAPLLEGLESNNATIRRFAVRGLGRMERPELLATVGRLLDDDEATIRAAAANAAAQAVVNGDDDAAAEAAGMLGDRLAVESDPSVRGALAAAWGRLPHQSLDRIPEVTEGLVSLSRGEDVEVVLGATRGLEWMIRTNRQRYEPPASAIRRLAELVRYSRSGAEGYVEPSGDGATEAERAAYVDTQRTAARIRRLAIAAASVAGSVDHDTIETALYDPDPEVRRLAALAVRAPDGTGRVARLLQIAIADNSGAVRYEGLRHYGRSLQQSAGCAPVLAALEDESPHVRLLAIDMLGDGCPEIDPVEVLQPLAEALAGDPPEDQIRDGIEPPISAEASRTAPPVDWHAGAHAAVALARLQAPSAARLASRLASHPTWQVRMYAAVAARSTGSIDTLERLSEDLYPNVANAAIVGLSAMPGRLADGASVRSLQSNDYQLLITAARTLEGTNHPGALPGLMTALDRITEQRRETSRDARRALLEGIAELGSAADAEALRPLLRDFEPVIATQVARIIAAWTDTPQEADPQPLDPAPVPTAAELRELRDANVTITMQGGGVIELRLLPFEAPTNAARFAQLAAEGYFDGLTFHRVVPNFVIQGGSPGANEFMGDGPYSRDELTTRSHLRGTVGLSTRGRDTGDAQIFVNLVDNVRLDHNYTIYARVVGGMDVVDGVLEGATIERVEIIATDNDGQ